MKILHIIGTKLNSTNLSHKLHRKPRFEMGFDTVEFSHTQKPFEELTLSTFQKLQEIKYTPSKLRGYYSTFIIDKSTEKPVTAFVKKTEKDDKSGYERYDFYVKNGNSKKLNAIGYCMLYTYGSKRDVHTAYMISFDRDDFAGMGIRAHQIAIERMLQVGAPNIILNPTSDAEAFHECCGFDYNTNWARRMSLSEKALEEWKSFINSGQRILR